MANDALPVDLEQLETATGGDAEFEQELIELFLEDQHERLSSIEQAIAGGDSADLRREAHTLKGAAANMGALALQHLARELEEAGRNGQLGPAPELLERIRVEAARVEAFLNARVGE